MYRVPPEAKAVDGTSRPSRQTRPRRVRLVVDVVVMAMLLNRGWGAGARGRVGPGGAFTPPGGRRRSDPTAIPVFLPAVAAPPFPVAAAAVRWYAGGSDPPREGAR